MPRELDYSALRRLLRAVRRAVPAGVRRRVRSLLFQWLDLTWPLDTGLLVRVDHYGDWVGYNEVFVRGEYDEALSLALEPTDGRRVHIVDLGAHVGFFTLRAVDACRRGGLADARLAVTAVEARAVVFRKLRRV